MQDTLENENVMDQQDVIEESVETPDAAQGSDAPSAEERIKALLHDMGAQKRHLLAIMDFCREERTAEEIDELLAPLMEHRRSVYGPIAMRSLLVRAGALEYHDNDEQPEEVADEAGNLVLPEPSVPTWLSTPVALEICEADDPYGELVEALAGAEGPAEAYALVLAMCDEEGRSISDISARLEESGVLEGVTFDSTVFVSKLEDIEALEWRGSWNTTDLGRRYLAQING